MGVISCVKTAHRLAFAARVGPLMSLASAMRCSAQHQKQLYETERNEVGALLQGQAAGQGA